MENVNIAILDTSVCSFNIGDFIIMDAVNKQLKEMFEYGMFFNSYTHDKISKETYSIINKVNYAFVGGTNLLSSNMNKYNQWKINIYDSFFIKDILLMGVGWWQYQKKPNFYTTTILKRVLNDSILHSVRDSYTEGMLKSIGIKNVINTSCPTMWELTPEHCAKIPTTKGDDVIMTLTDYNKNPPHDIELIKTLLQEYKTVHFWPQGISDIKYLENLGFMDKLQIIPPSLHGLDKILDDGQRSVDFVGTRLHAGVRALQKKRRTLIIGIDNRAKEKAKDFKINVLNREDISSLKGMLKSKIKTEITVPQETIINWKAQFSK